MLKKTSNLAKSRNLKKKKKAKKTNYTDFFQKHIEHIIKNNQLCQNCGSKLKGNTSEVAHIIRKSTNPEVAENDDNIVYLCGLFSENQCHAKFDSSVIGRKKMPCFEIARKKFEKFKGKLVGNSVEMRIFEEN